MTKRQLCPKCSRPLATCLCKHVRQVTNRVKIIILQHPQEAKEAKNTGQLLHLCLTDSELHKGEEFDEAFFAKACSHNGYDLLLYPETTEQKSLRIANAAALDYERLADENLDNLHQLRLWVLDATWRKSRKMLYLNPALQAMPRLELQDCPASMYKIRKAHSENQLSTLEASCYALRQLERNLVSYAPVLEAFANFVAEQQHFIPNTFNF